MELKKKEEFDRMKERMSLAHKNTSKWAKRQIRSGKVLDLDTRKALSAQVQRGEDLRKRVEGDVEEASEDEDHHLWHIQDIFCEEEDDLKPPLFR